jgi:hypothetical protein
MFTPFPLNVFQHLVKSPPNCVKLINRLLNDIDFGPSDISCMTQCLTMLNGICWMTKVLVALEALVAQTLMTLTF